MSGTERTVFRSAVDVADAWVKEVADELGHPDDRHLGYHAMRGVLHALRDRLTVEEALDLGAQLPMVVRGFYLEGWRPAGKPVPGRTLDQFLSHVDAALPNEREIIPPAAVARAVFAVLTRHVSAGEIGDVKATLPEGVRALWPP